MQKLRGKQHVALQFLENCNAVFFCCMKCCKCKNLVFRAGVIAVGRGGSAVVAIARRSGTLVGCRGHPYLRQNGFQTHKGSWVTLRGAELAQVCYNIVTSYSIISSQQSFIIIYHPNIIVFECYNIIISQSRNIIISQYHNIMIS